MNSTGPMFAVTYQGHYPTIYTLDDPYPIAICSSATLPDGSPLPEGQSGYKTAVTMKHGSFRSNGGVTYYTAGSEDFRAYVWKIPPAEHLKDQRRGMTTGEWLSGRNGENAGVYGHSSIVNTALFHPTLPLLATSGIERFIRLHRPFHASTTPEPEDSWTEEYPPTRDPPKAGSDSETTGTETSSLADTFALEVSSDPNDGPTISIIIETEGDLDIFAKHASQRVPESEDEEDDNSSESSSKEQDEEDDEIEIDL
ncbi:hypothetical protein FRB90_004466 [Tulasnella sp. 427]|nr:hypothetical protein FRB90_004466 [Tulasnella sp. 427]